jgi:hypothetical protein
MRGPARVVVFEPEVAPADDPSVIQLTPALVSFEIYMPDPGMIRMDTKTVMTIMVALYGQSVPKRISFFRWSMNSKERRPGIDEIEQAEVERPAVCLSDSRTGVKRRIDHILCNYYVSVWG